MQIPNFCLIIQHFSISKHDLKQFEYTDSAFNIDELEEIMKEDHNRVCF